MSFRLRGVLLVILIIGSVCLATGEDSPRMRSLTAKLMCNCSCGEHLGDCSHKQCERKPGLGAEISTAIQQGKSDDQILDMLAYKYGNDILLTPRFRGFDTMLWLVPAIAVVFAVGLTLTLQKRRKVGVL